MNTTATPERIDMLTKNWLKYGRLFVERNLRDCIAAGNMLLLLKETTMHGEFADKLNQLGLHKHTGRRLMVCARRLHNKSDAFIDAVASPSKLMALLSLDDCDLLALDRGEEVAGLTLERLAMMNVVQLRKALRDAAPAAVEWKNARTTGADKLVALENKVGKSQPSARNKNNVRLSVDEEQMLRDYRKCAKEAQAVISQTAKLLSS